MTGERTAVVNLMFADTPNGTSFASGHLGGMGSIKSAGEPRRATPPPYRGRGRPPTHGALVRPLARRRGAREFPATPADQSTSWEEEDRQIRAEQWRDLVLPDAPANAPSFSVIAIFDPK
jgi:hypothetical protein